MTTKQIEASIKRSNAAYRKATPAQRRVMIAKDAIKMIKAKNYKVSRGTFVGIHESDLTAVGVYTGDQLQTILHDTSRLPECRVCADGALFLSAVRMRNRCTVGKTLKAHNELPDLLTEFSKVQKQLIEIAFERGAGFYQPDRGVDGDGLGFKVTKAHRAAQEWADNFMRNNHLEKERLIVILKNIIRNKGTFNPNEK